MLSIIRELERYKALLFALVTRHLHMRYRGSVLGFLWSFLNPLMLMLVYVLVFRFYIRFEDVSEYTFYLFVGLLPWLWTTSALSEGAASIVSSGHLVTKSMFPAHILPLVAVVTTATHFLLTLPILFGYMAIQGLPFHLTLLLLPAVIGMHFVLLYGMVLALGSLNVQFRDVQHVLANVLTLLFFLCPILYPVDRVPAEFRATIDLNPFALLTLCYHAVVIEGVLPAWQAVATVLAFALAALLVGERVYDRRRERFAEML